MYAHDHHYIEKELPREIELRAEYADQREAVAPDVIENRPDIDDRNVRLLRLFAARIEGFVESWQEQNGKCLALDKLVANLAQEVAPVAAAARVRAKELEEQLEGK